MFGKLETICAKAIVQRFQQFILRDELFYWPNIRPAFVPFANIAGSISVIKCADGAMHQFVGMLFFFFCFTLQFHRVNSNETITVLKNRYAFTFIHLKRIYRNIFAF